MAICSSAEPMLRRYWEMQVDIGDAVQGWIYWTWKVWFPFCPPML